MGSGEVGVLEAPAQLFAARAEVLGVRRAARYCKVPTHFVPLLGRPGTLLSQSSALKVCGGVL